MNKKDDFEDFRRYEEYQRQKELTFAKGIGRLFYLYMCYSITWFMTAMSGTYILVKLFGMDQFLATLMMMFFSFFIFKLQYVKQNPFKSLMTSIFVFTLLSIAFS